MRRAVLYLCLLGACRFGFDATSGDGDGGVGNGRDASAASGDGAPDVMIIAQSCTATQIALTLAFSPVRDVIATAFPGGTALGFISGASSALAGVVLDSSLVPNTDPPVRTSPIPTATYTYSNASLLWNGSVLAGSVSIPEGNSCYMKTYMPDMSTYVVASQRLNCLTGEPSVGMADTQTVSTWYGGSTLFYNAVMTDGNPGTPDRSVVLPATIENLSVTSGERALILLDLTNGECDFVLSDGGGDIGAGRLLTQCARPHATTAGTSTYTYVFEDTPSAFGIGQLEMTATLFDTSTQPMRGYPGRFPRVFVVGGDTLVAFRKTDNALGVMRAADGTLPPISGLPAGAPDAFEVAGPYVFATYGDAVYAVTCD